MYLCPFSKLNVHVSARYCSLQGKTLYFVRRLSGTHAWVCPKEIFQEDPEATGLRAVILKVLGYLKKVGWKEFGLTLIFLYIICC